MLCRELGEHLSPVIDYEVDALFSHPLSFCSCSGITDHGLKGGGTASLLTPPITPNCRLFDVCVVLIYLFMNGVFWTGTCQGTCLASIGGGGGGSQGLKKQVVPDITQSPASSVNWVFNFPKAVQSPWAFWGSLTNHNFFCPPVPA